MLNSDSAKLYTPCAQSTAERLNAAIDYSLANGTYDPLWQIKQAKKVCVFGTGKFFRDSFDFISKFINVDLLCDNNPEKWNTQINGLTCVSPESLAGIDGLRVIVMVGEPAPVVGKLINIGLSYTLVSDLFMLIQDEVYEYECFKSQRSLIIEAFESMYDNHAKELYVDLFCLRTAPHLSTRTYPQLRTIGTYRWKDFGSPYMVLHEDEAFVDAGAFTGDTMLEFLAATKNNFDRIYSYEMAPQNFRVLQITFDGLNPEVKSKISIYNKGVWSESCVMKYGETDCNELNAGYNVGDKRKTEHGAYGEFVDLDTHLRGRKITIIKMDIEGSEVQALKGASEIIKLQKPKLAICVYHKFSDLWQIPLLIKSLNREYKLYLEHHAGAMGDSVLYAL